MPARPEAPRPRPALARAGLVLAGTGLGAVTALAITDETASQLTAPGGVATFTGSLTGLVGTYLALMMVLLVSRIPAVERVLGQDGLLRWHRRLAPWPISLLIAHALFITIGYAQAARAGLWHHVRHRRRLAAGDSQEAPPGDLVADPPVDVSRPRDLVRARPGARAVLRRAPAHPDRVVGGLGGHRGPGAVLPVRPAGRAQPAPPPGRDRSAPRGARGGLGHLLRTSPGRAGRRRRPVLLLALPHPAHVVAGPPLFSVGPAPAALPAAYREGRGRSLGFAGQAAARHQGGDRGPVRGIHQVRAATARDPAGCRGHRCDRAAVAAGRPATQLRPGRRAAGHPGGGHGARQGSRRAGPVPAGQAAQTHRHPRAGRSR